jgi:hypothetical protein
MKKSNKTLLIGALLVLIVIVLLAIILRIGTALNLGPSSATKVERMAQIVSKVNKEFFYGELLNKVYEVPAFDTLNVGGDCDIEIKNGNKSELTLQGSKKALGEVQVKILNNNLNIENLHEHVNIILTTPTLHKLRVGGAIKLTAHGIDTDKLIVNASGNGEFDFSGIAREVEFNLAGHNVVNADGLKAEAININVVGENDIAVFASKSLQISGFGDTTLKYFGKPLQVRNYMVGQINIIDMS